MVPECWSVSAVSSLKIRRWSPRRPAESEGRLRETQTVSETTTTSVFAASPIRFRVASKFGEPTSSSVSQRKRMFTGTPAFMAARAPKSAVRPGPLSSVVPRPKYVSPSRVKVKGSVRQGSVSFEAGCTSMWL